MALLQVQHISKKVNDIILLDDISFEQQPLQKIAITGESGAGKTTLLKIISGHGQADSGTVLFEAKKVAGSEEQLLPGHKKIAYLSQHYELLNNYYVEELVWFGNQLSEENAGKLFDICRITHLLRRRTNKLSGGEKQRIALCMLLVKQPVLLVLDEPFSNLDPIHTDILKTVLDELTDGFQISCILTSHDPHDTLSWADEIIVMKEGKIVQQGAPEEIYHTPINEYVAGMFGRYNLLTANDAAVFGIELNGKTVMLRPEEFVLSKNPAEGVKGVIEQMSFRGSFYELQVLANNVSVVVRTMSNEWRKGDTMFIKIRS
ncbi:ABC transporter ATP-binding protein [Panacibacter sp. DH6]|uniref:ABC transporter ATP-binding protein n=1 Tax=Panacibacter microcysteis TaxID=2793269 RepID=A0A931E418_9BACT|nr:ABC transporter ATP-binding protein [Panacibacter microcysteis]MBG9374764.1 ABC transporter ATP-binding protein [Panacibacter microcysteis]